MPPNPSATDQQQQPLAPSDPAMGDAQNLQVPPDLEPILQTMIRRQLYTDVETDKVLWYAQARKCQLYWSGRQWVYPIWQGSAIVDWQPLPEMGTMQPKANEMPARGRYDTIENFVRGDGNKFCAVLGEKSPNPKCLPLDAGSPDADMRAKLADRILLAIRRMWKVEEVHRLLVLSCWKNGTFFLHTPWETDSEKYGMVPKVETLIERKQVMDFKCMTGCGAVEQADVEMPPQVCATCGRGNLAPDNPQELQIRRQMETLAPGAAPGLYPASFYEVTMPFYIPVLQFSRSPWLIYEREVHRGELIDRYPSLWERIHGDIEQSEWPDNAVSQAGYWTRNMRSTVNTDIRQTSRYRWIESQIWFRASQYNMFGNQTMSENGQTIYVRDWFRQHFANGCRITRVGQWIVDMQPETMCWHWSVGTPMISETVACDPVVLDFLQIQDAINSTDNLFQENMERNLPVTLADQDKINIPALSARQGSPGELIPIDNTGGGSLKDALYNMPTPTLDGQNFGYREKMLETGREITGVTKAIFGASNASTAHEAELQKTQAMLQLTLVWKGLQACWRGAYENALRMLAMFGADVLVKWGLSQEDAMLANQLVDESGGLNGITVLVEEGIPATWGQIRDAVMFLIQQGPPSWHLSGLDHPANASNIQDALGIPTWITPGGRARDYVLKLIKRLLSGQIQQPMDMGQGQDPNMPPDPNMPMDQGQMPPDNGQGQMPPMPPPPPMPMPSEQIDQLILPQALGIPLMQEWFMSDEGMEASQTNVDGFANLHLAFEIYSAPPPMPPGGPEGGGPGNDGKKGPPPPAGQGPLPPGPQGPGPGANLQNMNPGG